MRDVESEAGVRARSPELSQGDGWRGAFAAVAAVSCVIGSDAKVHKATPAFLSAVGRPADAVIGRPYTDVLDFSRSSDVVAASLADGVGRSAEGVYVPQPAPRLLTTHPFHDERGDRRLVVTLSDSMLRERRRLLQAARLADIGVLAAGFAHEINSPLAAIALRAESLLAASRDPHLLAQAAFARFPKSLQSIHDDVFRCKAIVGALLDYARTRPQAVHPVDLSAILEQAVGILRHTAALAGVTLDAERAPAPALVMGDEGQLRQAVVAVARNAIEASARGGHVRLALDVDASHVRLRVRDQGAGMPDEVREKMFVPFFTTKPTGEGMGLGLSLCASTVAAHGGDIHVETEPGRGTEVTLRFPVSSPGPRTS